MRCVPSHCINQGKGPAPVDSSKGVQEPSIPLIPMSFGFGFGFGFGVGVGVGVDVDASFTRIRWVTSSLLVLN